MNYTEKLAGAYLRLNGFLTMPQFTVFDGIRHSHIDILALRAPKSQELVDGTELLTDQLLFDALGGSSRTVLLGVAAEVRTNTKKTAPTDEHIQYASKFLGQIDVKRISFFDGSHEIRLKGQIIEISIPHAKRWIQKRVDWMLEKKFSLTKTGSWNWSEPFLSDFLASRKSELRARTKLIKSLTLFLSKNVQREAPFTEEQIRQKLLDWEFQKRRARNG